MNTPPATPAATTPVRLAIVDDHILFRKGLRALLSGYAGIEVVCEAGNGQELLELLDQGSRPPQRDSHGHADAHPRRPANHPPAPHPVP